MAQVISSIDHHLGQVGQFDREIPKFTGVAKDVAHIDAEHLAVFESIQRLLPGRVLRRRLRTGVDFRQDFFQLLLKLLARFAGRQGIHARDDRVQIGVLHAQKIIPKKIAHPQQPRQRLHHLWAFQRTQFIWPVGAFEQLADKFPEVQQGRFGVG